MTFTALDYNNSNNNNSSNNKFPKFINLFTWLHIFCIIGCNHLFNCFPPDLSRFPTLNFS